MSIALRDQLIKSIIIQFGEQCRESLSIDETRRDKRASRENKGEDGEVKNATPPLRQKKKMEYQRRRSRTRHKHGSPGRDMWTGSTG